MATKEWKENNQEKLKEYRRQWYANNKEYAKSKVKERKKDLQQWFNEYKRTLKCERCPENHPACLDFHHLDGSTKEFLVAHMANNGMSKEKILEEIAKCIVLCANCHRKEHCQT